MERSQLIILAAIGAAVMIGAASLALHRYHAVQRGIRVEGTVVDQDVWPNTQHPSLPHRYPIVEFTTESGEKVRVTGSAECVPTGTRVNVAYDPRRPADALISDGSSLWGAPIGIAVFGLMILGPALFLYLKGSRQ